MAENNDLYKIVHQFVKSLSDSGFPEEPEEVDPIKEIPEINKKLENQNKELKKQKRILYIIITVLMITFASFLIDAIYFHITNNRYFENVYELKNNHEERIDNIKKDLDRIGTGFDSFRFKHPEFFR